MPILSSQEESALFELIEEVTGTCQKGQFKKDVLLSNVERRMSLLGIKSFPSYLLRLSEDDHEYDHFISISTIHTTYWFRENPHYQILEEEILKRLNAASGFLSFRFWSSACSTGQEAYSLALVMEKIFQLHPRFSYEIYASDIDGLSVNKAIAGRYSINELKTIPPEYHRFLEVKDQFFTLKDHVKRKMKFFQGSLTDNHSDRFKSNLDFIICRNVLIYFDSSSAMQVIRSFEQYLSQSGLLVLGHSENFETTNTRFTLEKNSCFRFEQKEYIEQADVGAEILRTFMAPQLIVIGASTGGPETLEKFLKAFPKPTPPIVVIQHINPRFSESFARRIASISGLDCVDTRERVALKKNCIYLPWGDYHLQVVEERGEMLLQTSQDPLRHGHRASVDVLFESVARTRIRAIGVLLTGMGCDGAEGLLKMKRTGRCLTMGQNKESSIVYGMPREAAALGAVHLVGSDKYLSQCVREYVLNRMKTRKAG